MTQNRYTRQMLLASIGITVHLPMQLFRLIMDIHYNGPVTRYPGWNALHATISETAEIPASVWRQDTVLSVGVQWNNWATVFLGVVYFLLLGTTREVREWYKVLFRRVAHASGIKQARGDVELPFMTFEPNFRPELKP